MSRFFTILAILTLALAACKEMEKKVEEPQGISLPTLPTEIKMELLNACTGVDYQFASLPFSINQDEDAAVKANIMFIGDETPGPIPPSCKPIGREFFVVGGDIKYEADIYFTPGCMYYLFMDKDKYTPKYANKISQTGMAFYQNLIDIAKKQQQQ